MKVETIGKMLIAAGVIFLLYAMSMPVSVGGSGIVNIHLISERQNTLLFGGLLFLAGIILFAVFKLKQTKEESDIAEKETTQRTAQAKVVVNEAMHKVSMNIETGGLSRTIRIIAGLSFGIVSGALTAVQWPWYKAGPFASLFAALMVLVAMTAYAFRDISTKKVLIHLGGTTALLLILYLA